MYTLSHLYLLINDTVYTPSQLTVLITSIEYTFAVYTSCIWEGVIKNPQLLNKTPVYLNLPELKVSENFITVPKIRNNYGAI